MTRTWPYRLTLVASLTLLGGLFQADSTGGIHLDQVSSATANTLDALLIVALWEILRWGWRAA